MKIDQCPLQYYERNIMFFEKSAKAVYKYRMLPYAFQAEDDKKMIINTLDNFFHTYRGKGKILVLNRLITPEEMLEDIDELQQANRFPQAYDHWKDSQIKEIAEKQPFHREMFLILDIPKRGQGKIDPGSVIEKGMKNVIKDTYRKAAAIGLQAMGIGSEELSLEELNQIINDEETLFSANKQTGQLSKASIEDIEFLLRAPFYRSLGSIPKRYREKPAVTRINKDAKVYIRPHRADILELFNDGWIQPDWKYIAVHHGEKDENRKTSYQANLVLTGMPDYIEPVGHEWIHWLASEFQYPIDVCVDFEITEPKEEMDRILSKKHDMKGEIATKAETNLDVSSQDFETQDKGDENQAKRSKGYPLMEMEMVIAISATNKELLFDRVNQVQKVFSPRMFQFSNPPQKSVYLWEKFFPWSVADSFWKFPVDPGMVSAGGIHCTSELGTERGALFAFTDNGQPVLADFGWAMRKNRPGTVVLLGSMGGGKSATMKAIIKNILLLGGYGFIADPKGEFHVFEKIPEFRNRVKILRFGAGYETTRLNIFRTSSNPDRAWQVAKSYLTLILNTRANETRSLIVGKALKETMADDNRSMMKFIEIIRHYYETETEKIRQQEARTCLELLESYQEDPLAKIVFHDDNSTVNLDEYNLVVADYKGLPLPRRGMQLTDMDDTMKLALGVVLLTCNIGRELLQHRPNDVLKVYGADEYWMLDNEDFDSLNKELVKMSRSQYVVPVFATQEAGDIKNQEVRNNIGWVLCGRSESRSEILDAMTMLGIEKPEDEDIQIFSGLDSGEFFARDPLRRREIIKVYQPKEWLEYFKTTPTPKKGERYENENRQMVQTG